MYKYKYICDSALPKYKARIVAKAYKHEQGVDFDEIITPTVKMNVSHMVLKLVTKNYLHLFKCM